MWRNYAEGEVTPDVECGKQNKKAKESEEKNLLENRDRITAVMLVCFDLHSDMNNSMKKIKVIQ